jgi:hypothetical protein
MDNTPHGTDAIGLDPRPSSALAYALSVREPWASLIANGEKTVENRTWAPRLSLPFRIAIHASCRPDTALCRRFGIDESRLTLGAIIATVDVVDIVTSRRELNDLDARYWLGPVGWILRNARKLEQPIRCRGRLGLWPVPVHDAP